MKLPKIQEDECPQKNTYFASISAKPLKKYKTDKLTFDWQAAEVQLIALLPDQENVLQPLIQFQNVCKNLEVPHFYSYFFVNRLVFQLNQPVSEGEGSRKPNEGELAPRRSQMIKKISLETQQLNQKKSKWSKIVQLIQLRENLVSKINNQVSNNMLETVYGHLDDIRFINFEIVKKIQQWSQSNSTNADIHPFFLYEGRNYLIKMVNDNTNVINVLNGKAVKFLSPPNPFYLSRDGNKSSMSQTQQSQIDHCMEIFAKQKAQQLKMVLNPPKYVTQAKNQANQLKKLKNQLQEDRVQRIKNVYKSSNAFSSSLSSLRKSVYSSQKTKQKQLDANEKLLSSRKIQATPIHEKIKLAKQQSKQKRNKFQKMIADKEVAVVQEMRNSQIRINSSVKRDKGSKDKPVNKYVSKIQSLRKSVQQNNKINSNNGNKQSNNLNNLKLEAVGVQNQTNQQSKADNLMRLSSMSQKTNQLPKTVAEIKTPKPKIKLIMEKDTFVADVVRTLLPQKQMEMYKSASARKSSTSFFKPSQKSIIEEKEQQKNQQSKQQNNNNVDIKPVTQYRTLSSSSLSKFRVDKNKSNPNNLFSSSINKTKAKQKKNNSKSNQKSRSLTNRSENLSQILSPNKRANLEKDNDQLQQLQSQSNLRAVNNKLRQLTIMSIYGKKMKSISSIHNSNNPYEQTGQKTLQKKNKSQTEKDLIDQQLKAVKSRLNDLSKKKIYDRKTSTKGFNVEKKVDLVEKQKAIKKYNEQKEEQLHQKQKQRLKLLSNINEKDKRIQQLLVMLKKQQKMKDQVLNNVSETQQQQALRLEKQKRVQQIQTLKQKIKSENKLIKQQMQQQQKKFIFLKQKQFQMKQQQIARKYELDMQQMKQQYLKKNKDLQAKINEQQRKRKQNQLKILKQQQQMQQLKMQMEQKKLRQQILEEVLREQREKQQLEEQLVKENQQARKDRIKRQILEKEEMERRVLENFQEENRKLIGMFESIKRKNQEAEKQNQIKLAQLKRIEEQSKREEQKLKKLQQELLEVRQKLQQQQKQQKAEQVNQMAQPEVEDVQQLKLKVKEQILREMMQRRQVQQREVKIQEQQRAKKIAQIEEQIRKQLRRQEEQMEKIQKQERERYERMRKQIEQQHRRKMAELEKNAQQQHKQNNKNEQEQNKQDDNVQKQDEYKISKQEYEQQLKKALEQSKIQQQKRKQQLLRKQKQQQLGNNLQKQKLQQQHNTIQKKQKQIQNEIKAIDNSLKNQKNDGQNIKQQKSGKIKMDIIDQKNNNQINVVEQQKAKDKLKQQSITKQPTRDQIDKKDNIQPKKQQKQKQGEKQKQLDKQKQAQKAQKAPPATTTTNINLNQSTEQMLTKYQTLQQYLTKCKQIYIDDRAVPGFLTTFYSQFPPEVKEMLPYSQEEITRFMVNGTRKVDIYEGNGHSVGWIEQDKYVLIGGIGCVENVVRKYGQTQIQMTYIFNKTNPYQKQFLAKQVKIFDKVGFIFQKKLKQDNMYSIKLIIKVPSQILPKNFKPPSSELHLSYKLSIDPLSNPPNPNPNPNANTPPCPYSLQYPLSQCLQTALSPSQLQQYRQQKSQQSIQITNKMHHKLFNCNQNQNNNIFQSIEIDDRRFKIQVKLGLKYLQTRDYPCYVIRAGQYGQVNGNGNDKVYVANISSTMSIVVFPYSPDHSTFSLDVLLTIKTSKLQKQRQILLFLPIWKKSNEQKQCEYPFCPKSFSYSHTVQANFAYGSIISNNILKEQYKFIQVPFVFALFQSSEKGVLIRSLYGEVVGGKELVLQKR